MEAIDRALRERMDRLGIYEKDLEEKFVRAGGPGGQKVNKTSVAVQLRHPPSGIELRVTSERSQHANRLLARQQLCDKLEQRRRAREAAARQERQRQRRRRRGRPKRVKERILEAKRKQSDKKKRRRWRPSDRD